MNQTNMLEPVTYAHFTEEGLIRMWSRNPDHLQAVTEAIGKQPTALITTTQAEAYANARVREALEEAIDKVALHGGSVEIEAAIRALLPSTPAKLAAKQ